MITPRYLRTLDYCGYMPGPSTPFPDSAINWLSGPTPDQIRIEVWLAKHLNDLAVLPPEDDNDDEIIEALRLVLEADANVHAAQIKVKCHNRQVTLEGRVPSQGERTRAEMDAWYLLGVGEVINRIEVA